MTNTFKPIVNPYRKNKPVAKPATGPPAPLSTPSQVKKPWNPQNKANVKVPQSQPSAKPVTPINRGIVKKPPPQQTPSSVAPVVKAKPAASVSAPLARGLPKVTPIKRPILSHNMLKKKGSMKQQLKQEIALLKKQKTLASLQVEADKRRRQKQEEKEIKMQELQAMQVERQRIKDEKQRQKMEILKLKDEERLRKQQEREAERLRKQQERERKLEEKRLKEEQKHKENWETYQSYLLQCHQYQRKTVQYRQEQQQYQEQYAEYARMQAQVHAQMRMQAQMGMFHPSPMLQHGMHNGMHPVAMMAGRPTDTRNFIVPHPIAGGIPFAHQPNMLPQGSPAALAASSCSSGMIDGQQTQASNLISAQPSPCDVTSASGSSELQQDVPQVPSAAIFPVDGSGTSNPSTAATPGTQFPSMSVSAAPIPSPIMALSSSGSAFTSVVGATRTPLQAMAPVQPRLTNNMVAHPAMVAPVLPASMHMNHFVAGGHYQAAMALAPPRPPAPLPYPPVPPRGVQRIWQPWRQAHPQARAKPMEVAKLCEVTKEPSPFCHYELLEIKLVRPEDETSFGVNLKLFQQSILVDPEWYEEQTRTRFGLVAPGKAVKTETTPVKTEVESATPGVAENEKPTVQNPPPAVNPSASPEQKETNESRQKEAENGLDATGVARGDSATDKVESPEGAEEKVAPSPSGSGTQESKDQDSQIATTGQSSGESTKGDSAPMATASSESPSIVTSAASDKSSSNPEETAKDAEMQEPVSVSPSSPKLPEDTMPLDPAKSNETSTCPTFARPTSDGTVPKTTDLATTAATPSHVVPAGPVVASKPTKRRRRRVNFSVMLVVDATKQNAFREQAGPEYGTELLQPGDIVVSIGGTPLTNKTFAEACAIFGVKSEKSNGFISAGLVVARRPKPVPKPVVVVKPTPKLPAKIPKGLKPSNDPKDMVLANSNQLFQDSEFAAIADSIIRAIHQPSRLLGQRVSTMQAFEPMVSLLQKIGTLKNFGFEGDGLPGRSIPFLQTQWIERSQRIETEFRMKHQAQWTKKIEAEGGFQNVTFSSDAQRSTLRQKPRPVRGCRCGREDHEYLHDPKCLLYRDICRLVPQDVLSGLLKTEKKASKKKDASLNTVEKGFKDRLVKLKESSELEEQEARFVAHMEEVQVKQCNKAVFAPAELSSMILSSVFELQREFPTQFVDDDDEDESDDEEEADLSELTGDKRAAHSRKLPKNKKQKQSTAVPKMVNFRYMLRMLQYISKTWGHVYREPSHEDFAWRWELFHGHNSSQGQWESQAKNPRAPNSLPFETIHSGGLDVRLAADLTLLRSSVAEFYGSIGREYGSVMARIEAQKKAEIEASEKLSNPLSGTASTANASNHPSQGMASNGSEPSPSADSLKVDGSDATMTCVSETKNDNESATTTKNDIPMEPESTDTKMVDPSAATEGSSDIPPSKLSDTAAPVKSPVTAESKDIEMVDSSRATETEKTTKPLLEASATPSATASSTETATCKTGEKLAAPGTNDTPLTQLGQNPTESSSDEKEVKIVGASNLAVKKEETKKSLPRLDLNQESADHFLMAAHLLYPSTSGLYDELMALLKMDVLKLDPSGIPGLAMDWYTNVDLVILEDMDRCWGSDADPEGRFCINDELRDTLEEKWVKYQYGWALADDPDDLVFDYEVIDAWREAFQGEMEEQANLAEGVGRYGL